MGMSATGRGRTRLDAGHWMVNGPPLCRFEPTSCLGKTKTGRTSDIS